MNKVVMYSKRDCPSCRMAAQLLELRGVQSIEKILIDPDQSQGSAKLEEMIARTNRRTVPQIFIGNTHIGGYDDLVALDRQGDLIPLLGG